MYGIFKKYCKKRSGDVYIKIKLNDEDKNRWYSWNPYKTNITEKRNWREPNQEGYGKIEILNNLSEVGNYSINHVLERILDKKNIHWGMLGYKTMYIEKIEDLYKYMDLNISRMEAVLALEKDQGLISSLNTYKENEKKIQELTSNNIDLKEKILNSVKRKFSINLDMENE